MTAALARPRPTARALPEPGGRRYYSDMFTVAPSAYRRFALALMAVLFANVVHAAKPARNPETLRPGDRAPDFTLMSPDGRQRVRLADYRGQKPVVLIFGSYTCPPFRDVYPTLERLYREHGDRVAFHYVYIREAHAEDGKKLPRNQREGIAIQDPKTMEQRVEVAQKACAYFKTGIPALVDTMDNATDRAYAAWPSRIFLVATTGEIAVFGEPGPRGLVPAARALEQWLARHAAERVTK
jgi:thiol-disulfide isomerase/thioredoxin